MRTSLCSALVAFVLATTAPSTGAQTMKLERIADGLTQPLFATAPVGDERVFIGQKNGIVRILVDGELVSTTFFLNVSSKISTLSERGLLGMAFHPDYENTGWVFTHYSNTSGDSVISRWTVNPNNPNRLQAASEEILLTVSQPFANHNGGWLDFGPDGYLYIAFGDGGSANDPACRAQNPASFHGKILRIDVDQGLPYTVPADNPFVGVAGWLPEIYHYGLRNPWRCSFDRVTGDLYIGDVGQDAREEISFAPAGVGGINFGWKRLEGTRCNSSTSCGTIPGCTSTGYEAPIWEISHQMSSAGSITGGYVYRGCAIPSLQGTYVFADYVDDRIRSFDYDTTNGLTNFADLTMQLTPSVGTLTNIASFGEDGFGELLICDTSNAGEVYKIVPSAANAAGATVRNTSGTNALCYTNGSLPILGNVWKATVDVSGHAGATFAGAVGHAQPTSGLFVKGGEALVDLSSQKIFTVVLPVSGNEVSIAGPLPCDPALNGLFTYTQGFILGGGAWELCNALDLELGWF